MSKSTTKQTKMTKMTKPKKPSKLTKPIKHAPFVDPVTTKKFVPAMTPSEVELFKSVVAGTDNYMEFGLGGSTVLAAELGVKRLCGIDSDENWVNGIITAIQGIDNNANTNDIDLNLKCIDIGKTGAWGRPVDKKGIKQWPDYPNSIKQFVTNQPFDVILVDGRFRVACALKSFEYLSDDGLLMIHDFERTEYHVVLDYYDIVEQKERLVVLTKKAKAKTNVGAKKLEETFLKYVNDFR